MTNFSSYNNLVHDHQNAGSCDTLPDEKNMGLNQKHQLFVDLTRAVTKC